MFTLPFLGAVRLDERMSIEEQRQEFDRRQRAWVFIVIGALVAWVSTTGMGSDALAWNVVGYVGVVGGLAAVTYGLILFQKRRP